MKRRYFSFIALTLVSLMLVLTVGCGVRINGKEYELFKARNNEQKNNVFSGIGSESSNTERISEEKQEAEQLIITNNAGNIKIKKSESSQIEIKAEKKVRGSSEDSKKIILENMNIKLERNGKVIKTILKTKDGNDFVDWQKNNYKSYQITINFDIALPAGINEIEVSTGAGNIDVNDVSSRLSLNTGAGNIDIEDVAVLKDNRLSTGAGNIDFDGDVGSISSFDASTGAGNIKFKVPEETKMSLKADTGIGNLSGSFIKTNGHDKFHFEEDINGGGSKIKLSTGVGNVRVDNN